MSQLTPHHKTLTFVLLVVLAACSHPLTTSTHRGQKTFASPGEAGAALLAAARSGDHRALLAIFGPGGADVLFTGDPERDQANLRGFIDGYTRMNRWKKINAGGEVLYIGADNSAFPIPLGQNASGRWYFDTAAGKDEVLARRIGQDELSAIAACEAVADAQRQYLKVHAGGKAARYPEKLVSDPGKHNGLYWPAAGGRAPSPLAHLGDFAKAAAATGGDQPVLFNGYFYRALASPDGFALLAYPAEYRNTGIMTFLAGRDGTVYQKDLGDTTVDAASGMTKVDPADGWSPAVSHAGSAARSR